MNDDLAKRHLRIGWTAIAVFVALGLALEAFHLFKAPFYLEARLRRDLWTLGHAHGTLLGLLNLAFALTASRCLPEPGRRRLPSRLLLLGTISVPLGFLLGGLGNAEGDPSLAILLVPIGAAAVFVAAAAVARGACRR